MARRRLAALFLAIAVAMVMPAFAFGASGAGLVPCGVTPNGQVSDSNTSTECQACNVVQLIQELITFAIGLSIPIAMAMFAYAGFLYFSSGAGGGGENISKAKGIFRNAVIGFVLVLASWLIVNTILTTVVNSTYMGSASWFHVDCTTRNQGSASIGDVINDHLGNAPVAVVNPPVQSVPTLGCKTTGYILRDGECIKPSTGETEPAVITNRPVAGGSGAVCANGNPACSPSSLTAAGANAARANALSCIAMTESSGDPNARSGSSSACGTFQLLNANWQNYRPSSCAGLSCTNAACNLQAALNLSSATQARTGSYYSDWTCPGCNSRAAACVAKYDPGH